MALDLYLICILPASPSQGSRFIASTRQLVLRDRELVAFAGLDHELAATVSADFAVNRTMEKSVAQTFHDQPFDAIQSLAELSAVSTTLQGRCGRLTHCGAAPSYL